MSAQTTATAEDSGGSATATQKYTGNFDVVRAQEHIELGTSATTPITGLALSGGGIRSASFALGVVQALISRECLERFHYLSTVSGGGYLGTALNWLRARYGNHYREHLKRRDSGARTATEQAVHKRGGGDSRNLWIDYIRLHGNYLLPRPIGSLALLGVALRSLVVSLFVYAGATYLFLLALICLGMIGTSVDGGLDGPAGFVSVQLVLVVIAAVILLGILHSSWSTWVASLGDTRRAMAGVCFTLLCIALVLAGVAMARWSFDPAVNASRLTQQIAIAIAIASLYWSLISVWYLVQEARRSARAKRARKDASSQGRSPSPPPEDGYVYAARIVQQQRLGACLAIAMGAGVIATLPWIYHTISTEGGAMLASVGGVGSLYQFFKGRGESATSSTMAQLRIIATAAVLLLGLLTLMFALAQATHERLAGESPNAVWMITAGLLVAILLTAFCTNLNLFGIGRMYRDRLMETFTPNPDAIAGNRWDQATQSDGEAGRLQTLWRDAKQQAPCLYPLINSLVVLVDAESDKFRSRGGDNFVMSPLYCGSNATGYSKTEHFADGALQAATAMAISGAAVNPRTGAGGQGITRNRLVSFLMFLLQLRLGAWVRNPNANRDGHESQGSFHWLLQTFVKQRPNFLHPGVVNGLLGRHMREESYFVELTDGAHFDNTGIYELVRRRTLLIVQSQAGADPGYQMADLATAIERVRVDFGVHFRFSPDFPLSALIPSEKAERAASGRLFARRGFATAEILYPTLADTGLDSNSTEWEIGLLVVIMATPIESVPADVHSYHARNASFPNESTGDQFFDEVQLEAYRELGYANAKQALDAIEAANRMEQIALAHKTGVALSSEDAELMQRMSLVSDTTLGLLGRAGALLHPQKPAPDALSKAQ